MTTSWEQSPDEDSGLRREVVLECGWGRVIFGQTFDSPERVLEVLRAEQPGHRDICIYPRDPHVLLSRAPSELFVDPSHTYRLSLQSLPDVPVPPSVKVRELGGPEDVEAVNRIYSAARMLPADPQVLTENAGSRTFVYLVAEDADTGRVVGTVTGIDHVVAFGDLEQGTSLWCLAVDAQSSLPATGEALVRALAACLAQRGRQYLDLSVLHDNVRAIKLYERIGFERVPVLCVKRKNPINEPLFVLPASDDYQRMNPYARIIADEARRRGIDVEVLDAEFGELQLSHGGRQIVTRESLSELTTAVAMSRCDDKRVTRRMLGEAGLQVPRGRTAAAPEDEDGVAQDLAFLADVGTVVVKPARGEQGRGITIGITEPATLRRAVEAARTHCPDVLIEEFRLGEDLRIVVIGHEVVAAAVRRPPIVTGNGHDTITELILTHSRRRGAATGGESRIPLDAATEDTVRAAGWSMQDVLPEGETVQVRRNANLHTGGTIHDVTARLHPELVAAAVRASEVLDIPVTGLDFLVPDVEGSEYVIVEANERPGLANHEPQPTAAKFIDLLFPGTQTVPQAWTPETAPPPALP